ncbi:MAG: hypothetical protein Fur0037_11830 [Planctomycetota bacterium]
MRAALRPLVWLVSLVSLAAAPPAQARQGGSRPLSAPSRYGRLLSARWAFGASYARASLPPVPNPNPSPEPQPKRDHPFDVAVSADGEKVYVTLLGSEIRPGHEVAVYSVRERRIEARIPLRPRGTDAPPASGPYRISLHPFGFLVVTNRFSNFASVIDPRTDQVVAEIPLDFYAQGIAFRRDGKTAYVADRYLDQVLVVRFEPASDPVAAAVDAPPGFDLPSFERRAHPVLVRRCGAANCHDEVRGGFVAGPDARASLLSALEHVLPGAPRESRLLRAAIRTRDGGYADAFPPTVAHAGGAVFADPERDPDYAALLRWIAETEDGPGIRVGNERSKPKVLALSGDERRLFVGNTGTQDISVVDTRARREIGSIHVGNVVNDVKVYRSPKSGREILIATTMGAGFGVTRERDPEGGESEDQGCAAAQFTVHRDLATGRVLPREQQEILGPFDAVDGTWAIKFRDAQNDLLVVDTGSLGPGDEAAPVRLLVANRYEAHRAWVRYTSDTAESTAGDLKGDIPPELMRVAGALPEKMAIAADRLFVTMQGSDQVQELAIDPDADDPCDVLRPIAVYPTGAMPTGIASGRDGTPSEGLLFVANFLGGSLTVLDTRRSESREVLVDPSVENLPVPATAAEAGERFAHSALFSSDGDTSCVHCHYLDMGDGRPWGVSQVVGQEFFSAGASEGQLVIGGTMGVPQMRALARIQPFFYEGVISGYEPRSMIMENAPADDFASPTPQGDFTGIEAHRAAKGQDDVQSSMTATTELVETLEQRRDAMFQRQSMKLFGKAYTMRDFQRFVGEWQVSEGRLLPNPFDKGAPSVLRGRDLFFDPQVGCSACHPPPDFTRKDLPANETRSLPALVATTRRDGAFTLIGMNRLDALNGYERDLEPWDRGRAEQHEGHYTITQLRGIWDRPPVFLHNGLARSLREVVATPGHPALRRFRYEPLLGGEPERPGLAEVGFNATCLTAQRTFALSNLLRSGARLGIDTHGGTSHLSSRAIDDLVDFLETIE